MMNDVEVNSVEDGDADNYDNEVPSSAELYAASELRLNGDPSSQSHTAEHVEPAASNNRHATHDRPNGTRHRHSSVVTSLQVRGKGWM